MCWVNPLGRLKTKSSCERSAQEIERSVRYALYFMRQLFAQFFLFAVTSDAALLRIEVADRHDILGGHLLAKAAPMN